MKDLEDKNRRLKKIFADLSLECRALEYVIKKGFQTSDKAGVLINGFACYILNFSPHAALVKARPRAIQCSRI